MSFVDHHGEVEYPFSIKTVFTAIIDAAPNIEGLELDGADEISGRVTFKAGVSLASWGGGKYSCSVNPSVQYQNKNANNVYT